MQIAIVGAGHVGSTLGRRHTAGHDVTFAARDAARPQALAGELGERAHAALVADAVADAEVVLVAVPGPVVTDVLQAAGPRRPGHDRRGQLVRATTDNTAVAGRRVPAGALGASLQFALGEHHGGRTTTASRLGSRSFPATRKPSQSSPS